jgi:TolB protein
VLFVVPASGGTARRLVRARTPNEESWSPAWSPDGRRIAFSSNRDGFFNPEIYVVPAAGGMPRRLTRTAGSDGVLGDDTTPDWSPDGRRIAFASNRNGRNADVWVMNADGRGQRPLARTPADEWSPNWSPDGRRLLLVRVPAAGPSSVYALRTDGSALRRVAEGADPDWRP